MLWSVCTTVCVLTAVSAVTGQSEVVHTRYGALQGTRTRIGVDSYVDSFYNIPYAKPPTGRLTIIIIVIITIVIITIIIVVIVVTIIVIVNIIIINTVNIIFTIIISSITIVTIFTMITLSY